MKGQGVRVRKAGEGWCMLAFAGPPGQPCDGEQQEHVLAFNFHRMRSLYCSHVTSKTV